MKSYRFNEKDLDMLNKFMKENNIKNSTEAIRECIKRSVNKNDNDIVLFDINLKINRLIHNQYLIKKLLEQLFTNMRFSKNFEIESNNNLKDFYSQFDKYKNNFLG